MTTNMQQGTILDVLKKKMRQTKEEMEKYKDECEEYHKRLQVEIMRREEVWLRWRSHRYRSFVAHVERVDGPRAGTLYAFLLFGRPRRAAGARKACPTS
ncbi:hypothetical protein MSG28_012228 [Choristoneura fumiferana]|uniref:Uncharacterized protein n=1 Tax=Choristoneura fumiferana TaxID=7141 RepID=A0ACC0KCA0_CHOFU|nr:hypothetical protein MSG28_012228 [Choristoneura fumiferana]